MYPKMTRVLWYAAFGIIFTLIFVIVHENLHKSIFEEWGCEDIKIGIEGWSAVTSADCSGLSLESKDRLMQAQYNVETIHYPILMLTTAFFCWIMIKEII